MHSQWGDVRAQIAGLAILNVFALFVTGVLETVLRDRLKARQSQVRSTSPEHLHRRNCWAVERILDNP